MSSIAKTKVFVKNEKEKYGHERAQECLCRRWASEKAGC